MATPNLDFSELLSKMGGTDGTGGILPKTFLETVAFNMPSCPTRRWDKGGAGGTTSADWLKPIGFVPPVPPGHIPQVGQKSIRQASENKGNIETVPPVPPENNEVAAVTHTTREHLERIHPSMVAGLPLATILDHADPADYDDLVDRTLLKAFAIAGGHWDGSYADTSGRGSV